MGRAKLNMDLIKKDKARNVTYKKRKEGLLRKMHEFTTLCDVKACMIIYASKKDLQPEQIWPENNDPEVRRLVNLYRTKGRDGGCRTYSLVDFFDDRNKRMEEELEKLRKKNIETKFPTSFDFIQNLSQDQLRDFANSLDEKIEFAKNRIGLMRENRHPYQNFMELGQELMVNQQQQQELPGLIQGGIEFKLENQQLNPVENSPAAADHYQMINYPSVIQQENQIQSVTPIQSVNPNSMMMLLVNDNIHDDNEAFQFGGGGGGGGVLEDMVYNSAKPPVTPYYGLTLPSLYVQMQCPQLPPSYAVVPPTYAVLPASIKPELLPPSQMIPSTLEWWSGGYGTSR